MFPMLGNCIESRGELRELQKQIQNKERELRNQTIHNKVQQKQNMRGRWTESTEKKKKKKKKKKVEGGGHTNREEEEKKVRQKKKKKKKRIGR